MNNMDKSLLIAVFVPTTDETGADFQGQHGELATGFPVGKDLILTARHVLQPQPPYYRDRRYPVKLRWHYSQCSEGTGWIEIPEEHIVWESSGELDAALIRCPRPADAVGWGIVSHARPRDGATWGSEGFPRATRYEKQRNPSSFIGKVCAKAPSEPNFELTVEAHPDDEDGWKGVSGMPVFVDNKILGVVSIVPLHFNAKKLYATPTWQLLEDEAFRRWIGDDELVAHLNKFKDQLVRLLRRSQPAMNAIVEQDLLGFEDRKVDLDDERRADWLAESLLKIDIRTVIQALRDAHRPLREQEDDCAESRHAAKTLAAASQLIVPALYDYGVIQWMGSQQGAGSAALVPLPACTKTVAEIIMAGADRRATRFRHREVEDDQPEGELSLPVMPESGITADNGDARDALLRHLSKKFHPGESANFRRAVDDYLLTAFPRRARGGAERTLDERIRLTADLIESKRRDSGQTFYMIFELPQDAEGQNAMRAMVESLKSDYPAIAFLCLHDSPEGEREEINLVEPFCRMLPMKALAAAASPSSALQAWEQKLALLQTEEAKAVDFAQKFKIQQDIAEAKAKIRELGGSA
jgi:hypothetical protein